MIRSVEVINYLGDSLIMELARPELSGFAVLNIEGIGPMKATINTTRLATADGTNYNSSKAEERNIRFDLKFYDPYNKSIEEIRHKSYKYFPVKQKLTLKFLVDNRYCEIEGYTESNESKIFSKEEGCNISIICPRPYFKSSNETVETVFFGIESAFEFPFSNESLTEPLIVFGYIKNSEEENIIYEGDAPAGLIMTIHAIGPASNITIYNLETREMMKIDTEKIRQITGEPLQTSDDIIINTNTGVKSAMLLRRGIYTNILNALEKNPAWFQLTRGDNLFAYTSETGAENLQFKIENHKLYEGV